MTKRMLGLTLMVLALAACTAEPKAEPKPGGQFTGDIDLGGKASRATITFTVADTGNWISSVGIELSDMKCNGGSAEQMSAWASVLGTIVDGAFTASPSGIGEVQGRFTSPTQASGTIHLKLKICDLGTHNWSATAP